MKSGNVEMKSRPNKATGEKSHGAILQTE